MLLAYSMSEAIEIKTWCKFQQLAAIGPRSSRLVFLPYLNSAYNLARWLTRNDHDAEDVVQEAYLRAMQAFDSFQAERDGRPWFLRIVRNTCYTWMRQNRPAELVSGIDEHVDEATSAHRMPNRR